MNTQLPTQYLPALLTRVVFLFVCILLSSGCSSSSTDAGTEAHQLESQPEGDDTPDNTPAAADDPITDAENNPVDENEVDKPVVSPPTEINTTIVTVDITVPRYSSNELYVTISSGDASYGARWVGDESWSGAAELDSNTVHDLVITFYDRNGDIILATYETQFETDSSATMSYQVTSDQFDTESWDSDSDGVSNIVELTNGDDPLVSNSEVADPLYPNTTQVTFDIAVSIYASDNLDVLMRWGNKEIITEWVGDQYWTATELFPINAEQPLVVTMHERNGELIVGQFETILRTGSNAAEIVEIVASQFDTDSFDEDGDGISNIQELNAGSNPFIDESIMIEVVESYRHAGIIRTASNHYETLITAERPYFLLTSVDRPLSYDPFEEGLTHNVMIDIQKNGNGTFSDKYFRHEPSNRHTVNQVATRTVSDNSVQWEGEFYRYDSSAHVGTERTFSIITQSLGDGLRQQTGEVDTDTIGGWTSPFEISYSLVGELDVETNHCTPVAGSLTHDGRTEIGTGYVTTQTTVSKQQDDEFWSVTEATLEGYILNEFLARELETTFYCNFPELG